MTNPSSTPSYAERRPAEGRFAHMIRLWIEYHRRRLEFGFHPF